MPITNMGGLVYGAYGGGVYSESKGTVLSDGTILTTVRTTGTTVAVRFSTDNGATWTQCATTITTDNTQGHQHLLASDEFDYLYIQVVISGALVRIYACTFDGSDITVRTNMNMGITHRDRSSLIAIDNPTEPGNFTFVAFAGKQSGLGQMVSVNFNRDTEVFDVSSLFSYGTFTVQAGSIVQILLENTVADSRVAATPSSPRGLLTYRASSTSLHGRALTWDGTNHRWTLAGSVAETITTSTNIMSAVYDPTIDRYIVVNGESATVAGVVTGDVPFANWTTRADLSFASGAMKYQTLGLVSDGLGGIFVYHLEDDDVANIDLSSHEWNDGTPGFDSEVVVSSSESLEVSISVFQVFGWSAGLRYTGYGWVLDGANQPRIYSVPPVAVEYDETGLTINIVATITRSDGLVFTEILAIDIVSSLNGLDTVTGTETLAVDIVSSFDGTDVASFVDLTTITIITTVSGSDAIIAFEALVIDIDATVTGTDILNPTTYEETGGTIAVVSAMVGVDVMSAVDSLTIAITSTINGSDAWWSSSVPSGPGRRDTDDAGIRGTTSESLVPGRTEDAATLGSTIHDTNPGRTG